MRWRWAWCGCITQDPAPYNDAHWKFQFVEIIGFGEVGAEVCDANIVESNADWAAYFSGALPCDTGGLQLCSWASRVLRAVK